jgi:hypothetical protein
MIVCEKRLNRKLCSIEGRKRYNICMHNDQLPHPITIEISHERLGNKPAETVLKAIARAFNARVVVLEFPGKPFHGHVLTMLLSTIEGDRNIELALGGVYPHATGTAPDPRHSEPLAHLSMSTDSDPGILFILPDQTLKARGEEALRHFDSHVTSVVQALVSELFPESPRTVEAM